MKDAYYFPHYVNARNDRKIMRLRLKHGLEGYGVYFCILELLREQTDHKYPFSDIDLLCVDLNVDETLVMSIINDFGLFKSNKDEFYSPKLMEYLQPFYTKKKQASIAGKKSAEVRKKEQNTNDRSTDVQRPFNDGSTINKEINKVKEEEPPSFSKFLKNFPEITTTTKVRGEGKISPAQLKTIILSVLKSCKKGEGEARWYYNRIDDAGYLNQKGFPLKVGEMIEDIQDLNRRGWIKTMTEAEFREVNG